MCATSASSEARELYTAFMNEMSFTLTTSATRLAIRMSPLKPSHKHRAAPGMWQHKVHPGQLVNSSMHLDMLELACIGPYDAFWHMCLVTKCGSFKNNNL